MAIKTERFRAVDLGLSSAKEAGHNDLARVEQVLKQRKDKAIEHLSARGWTSVVVKTFDRELLIEASYVLDDELDRKLRRRALLGKLRADVSGIFGLADPDDHVVRVKRVKGFVTT